jgi:EAL domain-containing protein (putative c-di-GMP-specific phosphodiesterase class I)
MPVLFRRSADPGEPPAAGREPPIAEVIRERLLSAVFQPVVHLESGQAVAYEAVPRGPAGTALERPEALSAAAGPAGLLTELDVAVRAVVLDAAVRARLDPTTALFVRTVAPDASVAVPEDPPLARVLGTFADGAPGVDSHPVVEAAARVRAAGGGVALDGVALLSLLNPDVVRLAVSALDPRANPDLPRVQAALAAYRERTGANVLVTGIENEAQARLARAYGATLGTGVHCGRLGPLPAVPRTVAHPVELVPALTAPELRAPVIATERVFAALAVHVERQSSLDLDAPVVLACLPANVMPSGEPLVALQILARGASFTGALVGERLRFPLPGVTLTRLPDRDPLRNECTFLTLGPQRAVLLAVSSRGPHEVAYRLTYDRGVVVAAAHRLLARMHQLSLQPAGN